MFTLLSVFCIQQLHNFLSSAFTVGDKISIKEGTYEKKNIRPSMMFSTVGIH